MTIPRKKSRRITVDGIVYRWRAQRNSCYRGNTTGFFVQIDEKPSTALIDVFWGEYGYSSVTPELVEKAIRDALSRGWDPHGKVKFRGSVT